MLKLPYWANDFLQTKECPYCKCSMAESVVTHVGVKLHKETRPCLYFESRCKFCDKVAHTTIFTDVTLTPSQIASEIYHGMADTDDSKNIFIEEKSKDIAFDNEIKVLKSYLSNNSDHLDFLKFIGLTDQEIKNYTESELKDESN